MRLFDSPTSRENREALCNWLPGGVHFYEATHLGSRVQSWLYDRWAVKYDQGKKESRAQDAEMLARPVLDSIKTAPAPLILDLATGTRRFPLVLLREPELRGHVVAVDVSVYSLKTNSPAKINFRGESCLIQWQ